MLNRVRQEKPKRVGNYNVGNVIGKGATGIVYKGEHVETGQEVAIKLVSTLSIKEEFMKSIKKEMYFLKKLKHENIVKYIDFIQTDTHYAIILEYIESGSLYGIIKKFGPFQESLVIIFVKQVVRGLEYLHRQGIVHRDIKGANILTTMNSTSGIIKLTDFGVATHLSDEDKGLQCVGTPYYMAPEAIDMDSGRHITTSCDIWSLGCTIIELLTGNPPYSDGNPFAALFRMVSDPHPPFPTDISPQCTDFLMQCFKKEPSHRADAKNLLKHEWLRTDINSQVFNLINSPHPDLPEEVINSIRYHINESSQAEIRLDVQGNNQIEIKADGEWETKNEIKEIQEIKEGQMTLSHDTIQNSASQSIQGSLKNVPAKDRLIGLKLSTAEQPMRTFFGEETSFVGSMVENQRPLDSLRNYNFKKKNAALTLNSKREQKMYQDTQDIINGLSKIKEPKKAEEYMTYLSDIIVRFPKAKNYFIQQSGLTLFFDLLDKFADNSSLILSVLSFLNQITDQDLYFLELSCLFGVIPIIMKYTSEYYSKDIRFEASEFIGQLLIHSATMQIFLACGGCSAVVNLLDIDFKNNKEIIQVGMDMLMLISNTSVLSKQNLCRILCKFDVCSRLSLIFYGALEESMSKKNKQQEAKFLDQSLDLLLLFASCEDKQTKMSICEDETLQILTESLEMLGQQEEAFPLLRKTVLFFRHLSNEHNLLNKLENFGVILQVLRLLDQEQKKGAKIDEEFLEDLLKIVNYFQNLSHPRQEQLVVLGAVPILIAITQNDQVKFLLRKISLSILCHFVKTSSLTRRKLVELGGPLIFLGFLQHSEDSFGQFSFKILDTLASWLEIDFDLLQTFFLENIHLFIPSSSASVQLLQIIPIINRIISLSDAIAQEMVNEVEFVENLCCLVTDFEERNGQSINTPQIKMKMLEILFCILIRSTASQVCSIFEKHDLKNKLIFIIDKSLQLDIIILQEISENLLALNEDQKLQVSNNNITSNNQINQKFDGSMGASSNSNNNSNNSNTNSNYNNMNNPYNNINFNNNNTPNVSNLPTNSRNSQSQQRTEQSSGAHLYFNSQYSNSNQDIPFITSNSYPYSQNTSSLSSQNNFPHLQKGSVSLNIPTQKGNNSNNNNNNMILPPQQHFQSNIVNYQTFSNSSMPFPSFQNSLSQIVNNQINLNHQQQE